MLNKRINQLNADLSQLRLLLTEQKEELYYYLREKAELYSKIRKHKEKVKNS